MLRTLLLSLLCLLLLGPQAAFPVASGQAPPVTEKNLPLNRTTFHFFSPEDIAANYRSPKIVRVGYFDQHGVFEGEGEQLSGYAVALLTAVSRYTGWEYEWVKIRFDELAQRLDDGSIDLSCGISYTPERARLFDFSKLRAGYENTCLHVASTSDMHYMDLEAFNGMRIGFFADSLQYEVMRHFAAQNGFSFESLFFEESSEMVQALADGRIDGYVDGVLQGKGTKVVATISTDPFFFVTRRNNSAIMDPLNEAMRQILLNHPSYLARLYDSYLNIASDVPVVFTRSECRWLATSPAIRVAYSRRQDMMDPEHGGNFLFAFLNMLERQSGIRFEYLPQPSYDACLQALAEGTADIMTDVYPKLSFLRSQGIASGKTYYNAPITVVGRLQSKKLPGQGCTVGFTSEMRSVMLAYKSTYPEDIPRIFPDIEACRKAFEKGELDVYLWPYPAAPLQDDPPEDGLLLPTRAMYPMSLGISPHASPFVTSVLDKVITSTTTATLDALLLSAAPDSLSDIIHRFLRRNFVEALCGLGLLLVLIVLLVMRHIGARQLKANDIENRMVKALEQGEFTVFMQPQVCLADRRLHGAEALIRWQIPDGKMVYPDEFIPLFEQNGFIRELDLFVLDTVCAWIRRRLDEGKKVPPISINQSKALFFQDNYVKTVLGIAERHNVPARLLHVEVTESMAWLDEEAFIRTLEALRRAGIGLSLDDFGKGYSSLAMLHSFGFDTIKLDRAFLAPGQEKQRSVWIIISSLVDMARRLGIEILCEGVETEDQLQKLLVSHCKYGQGYLFSPPMNLDAFDAYVDAHELERK